MTGRDHYRNSIKESISAVEAVARLIANDPDLKTLSPALRALEEEIDLHPALRVGFDRLYGFTSDEDGIRHAMMEESDLESEDARFMLVACSAFVNYLVEKGRKAGLVT